jgi:hypothetical protein
LRGSFEATAVVIWSAAMPLLTIETSAKSHFQRAGPTRHGVSLRPWEPGLRRRSGNDELEPTGGDGWAELQDDGSLEDEIYLANGDDIPFIARRSKISSTAC